MTRIRVHPDDLAAAQRQFEAQIVELYNIMGRLERAITGAQWESDIGEEWAERSMDSLRQARMLLGDLKRLSERLGRHREEFVAADLAAYSRFERLWHSHGEEILFGIGGVPSLLGIGLRWLYGPASPLPLITPKGTNIGWIQEALRGMNTPAGMLQRLLALGFSQGMNHVMPVGDKRSWKQGSFWELGTASRPSEGVLELTGARLHGTVDREHHDLRLLQGEFTVTNGKTQFNGAVVDYRQHRTVLEMGPVQIVRKGGARVLGAGAGLDSDPLDDFSIGGGASAYKAEVDGAIDIKVYDLEAKVGFKACAACVGLKGNFSHSFTKGEVKLAFLAGVTIQYDVTDIAQASARWLFKRPEPGASQPVQSIAQ